MPHSPFIGRTFRHCCSVLKIQYSFILVYWCGGRRSYYVSVWVWKIKACWRETIFYLEKNKLEISVSQHCILGSVANYHWRDSQLTNILKWNYFDSEIHTISQISLLFKNSFVEINVATNTITVLNIPLWFLFFLPSELVFLTFATDRASLKHPCVSLGTVHLLKVFVDMTMHR